MLADLLNNSNILNRIDEATARRLVNRKCPEIKIGESYWFVAKRDDVIAPHLGILKNVYTSSTVLLYDPANDENFCIDVYYMWPDPVTALAYFIQVMKGSLSVSDLHAVEQLFWQYAREERNGSQQQLTDKGMI